MKAIATLIDLRLQLPQRTSTMASPRAWWLVEPGELNPAQGATTATAQEGQVLRNGVWP